MNSINSNKSGLSFFLLAIIPLLLVGCAGDRREPLQGEGWESSGGSGVACFDSEQSASKAEEALNQGQSLSPDLRKKVKTLVTLEYWEESSQWHYQWAKNFGRDQILENMHGQFEKHSPIFFSRLQLVQSRIAFKDWKGLSTLSRVGDAHPRIDISRSNPKCRLVQLAVRYSKSRRGYLPKAWVALDQELFQKLDPLNQAMLILHEEIYLIAKELVHRNSDKLRPVVAELLSDELRAKLRDKEARDAYLWERGQPIDDPQYPSHFVREPIARILGDYYLYFTSDPQDRPSVIPPEPGQYSRYLAFGKMLTLIRDRKGDCLSRRHYDDKAPRKAKEKLLRECADYAMDAGDLAERFSGEQAILFLARWRFDRKRAMQNSENLLVWNRAQPEKITELQASELRAACAAARTLQDEPEFSGLYTKARNYCGRLGL